MAPSSVKPICGRPSRRTPSLGSVPSPLPQQVAVHFHEDVVLAREFDLVSRDILRKTLTKLKNNPEQGKPLSGRLAGLWSIRIDGDKRLIYRIRREGLIVQVIAIGPRRDDEIYDRL